MFGLVEEPLTQRYTEELIYSNQAVGREQLLRVYDNAYIGRFVLIFQGS